MVGGGRCRCASARVSAGSHCVFARAVRFVVLFNRTLLLGSPRRTKENNLLNVKVCGLVVLMC